MRQTLWWTTTLTDERKDTIFDMKDRLGHAAVQRLDLHVSVRPASVVSAARDVQAFECYARGAPVVAAAREGTFATIGGRCWR